MNKFDECLRPFSSCWCESRPNNPHCNNQQELSIDNNLYIGLILISIFIYLLIRKNKITINK